MKANRYKAPPKSEKESSGKKLQNITSRLGLGIKVDNQAAFQYMPFILFLTVLGIIYIANTFRAEKLNHRINNLEKEVELLRVDYRTLKYDFINVSKRTQITEKVKKLGLVPSNEPPIVIEVEPLGEE